MLRKTKLNLLFSFVGLLGGMIGAVIYLRQPMETLTEASLAAARTRWKQANISDYDWQYKLQNDLYDVTVRDGIVTLITRDGNPTRSQDARLFSVEGLFDILSLELENLSNPAGPFAGLSGKILMRVRFHSELGYVERFLRSAGGAGKGASIQMIRFHQID